MSDFISLFCDLLPVKSEIRNSDNELRNVLDNTVGEFMDNQAEVFDELFLTTATGGWLDAFGNDFGVVRKNGESDENYRNRIVFEKMEHLTAKNLQEIYGLRLFVFVDGFDAKLNMLTSDNAYLGNVKMANASSDIQAILNNKFVLSEEIVWLTDNAIPFYKNIPVGVFFDDEDDRDGNRPDSIVLKLYANNVLVGTATVSESTDWETVFENMLIYNQYGVKYTYSITVDSITDYDITISEFSVVCSYNPTLQELTIEKIWDDDDDSRQERPSSVLMMPYSNNKSYGSVVLTSDTGWEGKINVPVRLNKTTASYTWIEEDIPKYRLYRSTTEGLATTIENQYFDGPMPPV